MSDSQLNVVTYGWSVLIAALLNQAISMPFSGALVRWTVHYHPEGVCIGDSEQPKTEPGLLVDGYFSTLRRVYRLEGWAGLYKGFWPSFLGVFASLLIVLALLPDDPKLTIGRPVRLDEYGVFVQVITGLIVGIPIRVLVIRAIVTPYKLRSSNPLVAYKLLLSPIERRQPWKIYLLPGVFISQFANVLFLSIIIPAIASWLGRLAEKSLLVAGILYLTFVLLGSCLQAVFSVAMSRFRVQRTRSVEEDNTGAETVADIAAAANVESYSHEDVIAVRDDQDPYVSFADYVNKVIAEEGWRVLLRAWWAYFLGFHVLAYPHLK
ncbi:hypothetical protein PQX77_010908 [Marasmius sp. AFHP31]|nr:hypothetical protein PQX77_010908 [Marasmius sp. AFHP31]